MRYMITIEFETNRPLTPEEQDSILNHCLPQVEEPVDGEGEDVDIQVKILDSQCSSE